MIRNCIRDLARDIIQDVVQFSPLDFGPVAWFDASEESGTVILNGSDVSGWNDSSGNGYHLAQATGSAQPAYANNTISFNGTTDYLWRAESFMYSATNTVTLFIVMESSAGADDRMISEGSSLSDTQFFCPIQSDIADQSRSRIFYRNNAAVLATNVTSNVNFFESGITKIYRVEDNLSSITTTINGGIEVVTAYTRPAAPFTLDRFSVGALLRISDIAHADIDVKEILIYNTPLDAGQKSSINTYLANKWQPFNPIDLSPLAWYDAADASTITLNGSDVSAWSDKSGNGHDLAQATGSAQPAYANNTISFNGTTDYLWRAESFMYSASNTVTVFMVMESSAAANDYILAEGSSTDSNPIYAALRSDFSNPSRLSLMYSNSGGVSGATVYTGADALESGITKVYSIEDDTLNAVSQINGNPELSVPYTRVVGSLSFDRFSVGALVRTFVGNYADIDVKEILIYNTPLDAGQKSDINNYLANKWGISI